MGQLELHCILISIFNLQDCVEKHRLFLCGVSLGLDEEAPFFLVYDKGINPEHSLNGLCGRHLLLYLLIAHHVISTGIE